MDCRWCGNIANTLADGGPVYIADRSIDVWFQDWTDEGHKMGKATEVNETLYFCRPECRRQYFFGL